MNTVLSAAVPRGQTEDVCPNSRSGPVALDRWDLLSLVTDLRRELGLADRDVMVLRAHLSVLPHGLLQPRRVNVSFMEVREILDRACGMEERRFRRGEAKLAALGLVDRRLSANGRRFPERDQEGKIVNAYGIDLSPIFRRYDELAAWRDRLDEEQRLLKAKKNGVSAYLQSILRAMASAGSVLPSRVEELRTRLRNAIRRKKTRIAELEEIEAEIAALEATVTTQPAPADERNRDTYSESSSLPETAVSPDSPAEDDGPAVRHIESELKEEDSDEAPSFNPLRIAAAWKGTSMLQSFYPDIPTREREVAHVLFDFSSFLGLGQKIIARALATFGWERLVVVLDYISRRVEQIAKPDGYIVSMIRSFEAGQPVAGGRVVPDTWRRLQRRSSFPL